MRQHRSQARPRQSDRQRRAHHPDHLTPRTGRSFKSIATSRRSFWWKKTPDQVVQAFLFGAGLLSAVLMDHTLAIIGTPLVLGIAARSRISSNLLLTLAVAITTGSLASPVGQPPEPARPDPDRSPAGLPVLWLAYRGEFQPAKVHQRACKCS